MIQQRLTFYTIVPLPPTWRLNFQRIARFALVIGVLIGGISFAHPINQSLNS